MQRLDGHALTGNLHAPRGCPTTDVALAVSGPTESVFAGGWHVRKRLIFSGCAIALGLYACADSGPQKIGRDTYLVSARVPFTGETGAKAGALETANKQCAAMGRVMLLSHISSNECALHGGCGEAEVTFLCVEENDPRYQAARTGSEP